MTRYVVSPYSATSTTRGAGMDVYCSTSLRAFGSFWRERSETLLDDQSKRHPLNPWNRTSPIKPASDPYKEEIAAQACPKWYPTPEATESLSDAWTWKI